MSMILQSIRPSISPERKLTEFGGNNQPTDPPFSNKKAKGQGHTGLLNTCDDDDEPATRRFTAVHARRSLVQCFVVLRAANATAQCCCVSRPV